MPDRIITIAKLFFLRSGNTSASIGRSQQRYERIARTAVSAVAAKVISVITGLVNVPLTLSYLGEERFGLWMTLMSFVAFLAFADMGVGIGLQNALSECDGKGNRNAPRGLVSSAIFAMFMVFTVLCIVALVGLPFIPWSKVLKTYDPATGKDLLPTAQVLVVAFGFGLPCCLIRRILAGYQKGYWANIILSIGNILALVGVIICAWKKLPLPILVAAVMGIPSLVLAFASCLLFIRVPWLRPSVGAVNFRDTVRVTRIGLTALMANIAYTMMLSGPSLIMANCFGTASVGPFSVTQRLLGVVSIIVTMAISPLWPAYREAAARGDVAWVTRAFRRSIFLGVATALPNFVIAAVAGQYVILIWTRQPDIVPGWSLLMACNVWALFNVWNAIASVLLNGLNRFIGQAAYGFVFAAISLFLSFRYADQLGTAGIVWVGVFAAMIPRCLFQAGEIVLVLRKLCRLSGHLDVNRQL